MTLSLSLSPDVYTELVSRLGSTDTEHVWFLFTEHFGSGAILRVVDLYEVPPTQFITQSAYHVALADEVRGHVIGRATEIGGSLVEVHTHLGSKAAEFSPSDLFGFKEWVPHVRWRLRGRPYVAIVFARDSFDALVWSDGVQEPDKLDGLIVEGQGRLPPTGLTHASLIEGRRGR